MFANSTNPAGMMTGPMPHRATAMRAFPLTGETFGTPTMRFVLAAILTAVLALLLVSIAGGR